MAFHNTEIKLFLIKDKDLFIVHSEPKQSLVATATGDMAMQGTMTSAAIVVTSFSRDIFRCQHHKRYL